MVKKPLSRFLEEYKDSRGQYSRVKIPGMVAAENMRMLACTHKIRIKLWI